MRDTAEKPQADEIPVIDRIAGGLRVRGSGADLDVRRKGQTAIGAEGAPEPRIVVGDAVSVSRAAGAQVGSRVVPHDGDVAGGRIERDLR